MFTRPSSAIQYGLEPGKYQELMRRFANRVEPYCASRRHAPVIVIGLPGDDPLANLARHIEFHRFALDGQIFHDEFDAWEASTHFLIAVDTASLRPVGSLRGIVTIGGIGQAAKTIHDAVSAEAYANMVQFDKNGDQIIDLRQAAADSSRVSGIVGRSTHQPERTFDRGFVEAYHDIKPGDSIYDVATLCNLKGRSALLRSIGPILCAASARMAEFVQARHMVAIMRNDLFAVLTRLMGAPFVPLGGVQPFRYCELDEFESQPAYQSVPEVRLRATRELHRTWTAEESSFGRSHAELMHLVASPEADDLFLF